MLKSQHIISHQFDQAFPTPFFVLQFVTKFRRANLGFYSTLTVIQESQLGLKGFFYCMIIKGNENWNGLYCY
jgi:hypothetical protein